MLSSIQVRRMIAATGLTAVVGMGLLGACATKDKPAETPAPATPTQTKPPSPTEKAVMPGSKAGSGPGNSFAPTVTASPPKTALPGNVITGG